MEKVVPRAGRVRVIVVLAVAGAGWTAEAAAAAPAAAEDDEGELYDETHYGERNTIELGGSVAITYLRDDLNVSLAPQFSWFFIDR